MSATRRRLPSIRRRAGTGPRRVPVAPVRVDAPTTSDAPDEPGTITLYHHARAFLAAPVWAGPHQRPGLAATAARLFLLTALWVLAGVIVAAVIALLLIGLLVVVTGR